MSKLDALWDYQTAELELERLEQKVKTTPSRQKLGKLHSFLSEQQSAITAMGSQLTSKSEQLTRMAAAVDRLEHSYELEASEFSVMEEDELCTTEEMTESRQSLESLLDQLTSARRELTDILMWIEKATADYKDTYAKAGKAKKEYDALRAVCESEMKEAEPEIAAQRAVLDKARSEVDPALMTRYIAIKSHYQAPMAIVENNQCSGCNMSLPTVVVKKAAAGAGIVECDNCGRILYAKL